jgi:hypothetical protein
LYGAPVQRFQIFRLCTVRLWRFSGFVALYGSVISAFQIYSDHPEPLGLFCDSFALFAIQRRCTTRV